MEHAKPSPPRVHRVVIVEDDLDSVHTLTLLLKEMGHNVDFAINGYVAYDVVRRFMPDTVICDIGLPGSTGLEVAKQIKKDPELRGVRLIALTAYSDDAMRKRAEDAGFDAYHVKPISPQELHALFM